MFLLKQACSHSRIEDEQQCPPHDTEIDIGSYPDHFNALYYPEYHKNVFNSESLTCQWLCDIFKTEYEVQHKEYMFVASRMNNGFLIYNISIDCFLWLSDFDVCSSLFHPRSYLFKFSKTEKASYSNPLWFSFEKNHYLASLSSISWQELQNFFASKHFQSRHKRKVDFCEILVDEFFKVIDSIKDLSDEELCKILNIKLGFADRNKMMYEHVKSFFNKKILEAFMIPPNHIESKDYCPYKYHLSKYMRHSDSNFHAVLRSLGDNKVKEVYKSLHPCRKYSKSLKFFGNNTYLALKQSLENRYYNIQFMNRSDLQLILDCYQIQYHESQSDCDLVLRILKHEYTVDVIQKLSAWNSTDHQSLQRKAIRTSRQITMFSDSLQSNDVIKESWPDLIDIDTIQDCTNKYMNATNLLQPKICCCCTHKRFNEETFCFKLDENPDIKELLHLDMLTISREEWAPFVAHSHRSLHNVMLSAKGFEFKNENEICAIILCRECSIDLKANRLPKISLANNLYRGELPQQFKDMTWVEEMTCAIYRGTAYVTRLYESPDASQP